MNSTDAEMDSEPDDNPILFGVDSVDEEASADDSGAALIAETELMT